MWGCDIRHQHFAIFRFARQLAQLFVIGHGTQFPGGQRDERGLPGSIQTRVHTYTRRRGRHVAVKMGYDSRSAIEPDHSESPREACAEVFMVAVGQGRL